MAISKSKGSTPTEQLLSRLCEKTFLKLWSYPNPFKDDNKELCDLLVTFDNHVLIFFDRESNKFSNASKETDITWKRWKKEVIDKQVKTSIGAERYIKSGRSIFLDDKKTPFPLKIPNNPIIHKIIIAHGAKEACKSFSDSNISGSLAVLYGDKGSIPTFPFMIELDRSNPVHVLDSENLEIIFDELDTVFDFTSYLSEKERAIKKYERDYPLDTGTAFGMILPQLETTNGREIYSPRFLQPLPH